MQIRRHRSHPQVYNTVEPQPPYYYGKPGVRRIRNRKTHNYKGKRHVSSSDRRYVLPASIPLEVSGRMSGNKEDPLCVAQSKWPLTSSSEYHTTSGRRHRIEHLELTSSLKDAKRLGALGLNGIYPVRSRGGLGSLVTIAASVLSPTVSLRMRVLSLLLGLVVRHCRGLPQIICTLRQRDARRGILGIARLLLIGDSGWGFVSRSLRQVVVLRWVFLQRVE